MESYTVQWKTKFVVCDWRACGLSRMGLLNDIYRVVEASRKECADSICLISHLISF